MAHVFISYSSRNRDYALRLARKLRDEGIEVWIDQAGIRSGGDWSETIFAALRAASAVIVIMTPDSLASDWVQREILIALDAKKRIFPVLLAGDRWDMLVHLQYEDVRTTGGLPSKAFYEEVRIVVQIEIRMPENTTVPPAASSSDQITSLRGCLRNALIIAALIGAVGAILAAIILVIGPAIIQPGSTVTPAATTAAALVASSTPAALTTNVSPTHPPTATQTVTLTEPTAMQTPTTQSGSVIVDVVRGRGIIALTTTAAIDLSGLQVDFGYNERYLLGEIFSASTNSGAGQTWCIRQPERASNIDLCSPEREFSYSTENTLNIWANIAFRWQGQIVSVCELQERLEIYTCRSLRLEVRTDS